MISYGVGAAERLEKFHSVKNKAQRSVYVTGMSHATEIWQSGRLYFVFLTEGIGCAYTDAHLILVTRKKKKAIATAKRVVY